MGTLRTEPIEPDLHAGDPVLFPPGERWGTGPHDARFIKAAEARRDGASRTLALTSRIEVAAGLGGALIALVGLGNVAPVWMAAIATMVFGCGMIVRGGSLAARWRQVARQRAGTSEVRTGVAIELLAGVVGVIAGALAPASSGPVALIGVATILFGAAVLLGGPEQSALDELAPKKHGGSHEVVQTSAFAMIVVGLLAAILGGVATLDGDVSLALVSLLCLGVVFAFAGGALATRLLARRRS